MKSIYRVTDSRGGTLCFQVAESEEQAVEVARMYGHRRADAAEFVREDN